MNANIAIVAELTGPVPPMIPAAVTELEVRADLIGDPDPDALRRRFAGRLIYSLRSTRHGGRCADPPAARHRRLATAAARYDLIDMEADDDLTGHLLTLVPPRQRRVSWHGDPLPVAGLADRFAAMARVPAAGYLLAPYATTARQALAPLRLLARLGRPDVIAYGEGPAGTWSRLLAPYLGAPAVRGALAGDGALAPTAGGAPDAARLGTDYPYPELPPVARLCGLIGAAAARSAFPRLFNDRYRDRPDLRGLYLPFYLPTQDAFRTGFWPAVPAGLAALGLPVRALTVSGPLKEAALAVADTASPAARASGCANALVHRDGGWHADTTDGDAVVSVLERAGVRLAGRRAAVVGCGGAGRAAAVALAAAGAHVTVVNRTPATGRAVARRLGLPFQPLASFAPAGAAVVVHATPACDEPPFPLDRLTGGAAVVVELLCPADDAGTPLIRAARRRGLVALGGPDILAAEAEQQFRLMTGRRPVPVGRE